MKALEDRRLGAVGMGLPGGMRVDRLLTCGECSSREGVEVPLAQINLFVGLAVATPSYHFPIIAALAQASVEGGLKREVALRLAAGVVRGSGALVLKTGQSLAALMALTPPQSLCEAEAKALFIAAAEKATTSAESLKARPGL